MLKKGPKINFNIPFINRVSFLDKIILARNLALMIEAGLPLRESLATLKDQSRNTKFRKILNEIIKDIDNGQSLYKSFSRHSKVFDSFYLNMIKIGEASGTLAENLKRLAEELEKIYELRGKIKAAMIYPTIVLIVTTALGLALSFFVLPKIVPLFKTFDVALPFTTRALIAISDIMKSYGLISLLVLFFP